MKAIRSTCIIVLLFCSLIQTGRSQVDRSTAPEAGPPPEVKLESPHSFELENGLKVFVVEDHSLPVLSFYLQLDHDPILEGDKKGYVSLTGSMLDRGTEERNKKEIAQEVDMMGASLRTSGSSIYANSLKKHSGKLLDVMSDVLLRPTFPEEELEKLKTRTKSGIRQEQSEPSAIRGNIRKAVTFGKEHPYGEVETLESIDAISVEDCKSHHDRYWRPNVAYLAVVGDVTPEEAEKMVRSHFSEWKKGDVPSHEYEDPELPASNQVALGHRSASVQSSLVFSYPVELEPGDEDELSVKLMNSILGGGGFSSRLLKNIREDKAYTYGVFSNVSTDPLIASFDAGGDVDIGVTDSAIIEFIKEMRKIKEEGVTKEELKDHRNRMAGGFTLSLENPQTIARYAINIDRYGLPEDHYKNYLKRLDAVGKKEVDRAAEEYIKPTKSHIVVVGDRDSLAGKLERFGELTEYDEYGFEFDPSELEAELPEGLTPEKLLSDYEEALGGKEAIEKIEDLKRVYTASLQGRTLNFESLYKHKFIEPSGLKKLFGGEGTHKWMSATSVKMGGMALMKTAYNGDSAYQEAQGNKEFLEGEELEAQNLQSRLFPIRNYPEEEGIELEILKAEKVRGEPAAVLKVTMPSGDVSRHYFSLESGLLLKSVSEGEGPQGQKMEQVNEFLDHEEREGVKFPTKQRVDLGMQSIEMELEEIRINEGVPDDAFSM